MGTGDRSGDSGSDRRGTGIDRGMGSDRRETRTGIDRGTVIDRGTGNGVVGGRSKTDKN